MSNKAQSSSADEHRKPRSALASRLITPWVAWALGPVFIIALGFVLTWTEPYYLFVLAGIAILIIAVAAQSLLAGYAGQPAFAGAAFYAMGAYSMAWQLSDGVPWLLALPASAGVGIVGGLLAGLPAWQVRGPYLVVVSVSLVFITQDLLLGLGQSLARVGSFVVARPGPISGDLAFFYCSAGVCALTVAGAYNLVRSRSGRALRGLRAAEEVCAIFGINAGLTRAWIYMLNGFLTALAGALAALRVESVTVTSFDLSLSVVFLAALLAGGMSRLGGAILGAAAVGMVTSLLDDVLPSTLGTINLAAAAPILLSGLVIVLGWTRRVRGQAP
jgi:branched-chain amino acid transport system permease protein